MLRTLVFTSGESERLKFALLWNAFLAGGNQVYRSQQGQRAPDERRKEAKVIRALKGISVVVDAVAQTRTLAEAGGSVVLEQPCFVLLERYLGDAPMPTEISDELDAVIEWVSAAPKSDV